VEFLKIKTGLVDYHIHSTFSYDGRSSINDLCERAVELKFREIGFSEHVDFDPSDKGFGFFNNDKYESAVKKTQQLFKDKLVIRRGVEIDYQTRFENQIRDWIRGKSFDFVIGSVHYIQGEIIDQHLLAKRSLKEVYEKYFAEVQNSIDCCLFNIAGHLDVVRKYASDQIIRRRNTEYQMMLDSILEGIIDRKIFLEINTKPFELRHDFHDTLPSKKAIRRYLDRGGKRFSIGSDTHIKDELGNGIKEMFDFLMRNSQKNIVLLF
jgi:histidinol-phosphatase (PHP family)